MKLCQICGHTASDSAQTCPKCGEGSWAKSAAKPEPKAAPKPAPEPEAKPSRSSKRERS